LIVAALQEFAIDSPAVQIAAAATVMTETGCFRPIREKEASPIRQPDLWRSQQRYYPSGYYGRGFVQLTWQKNYQAFGAKLGVDLSGHPELAMNPTVAARVLALYFRDMGVAESANEHDWKSVRRRVNGGLNGWDQFKRYVDALVEVPNGPTGPGAI
jgi:predicted chitinase